MAESTIKKMPLFGTEETISIPFTAPKDGFIRIIVSTDNNNEGYVYFSQGIRLYAPANGWSASAIYYIKKGQRLELNTSSSNIVYYCYYMPLQ